MEHHANVVPWHILAAERGVELRWIPLTADYRLDLTDLDRAARRRQAASRSPRCRTCSAPSTTSARSPTPPTPPARTCSSTRARPCPTSRSTCRRGTPTSSRSPPTRCCGPTGIGALWARRELLEAMPPFLGGGEMIRDVTQRRLHAQRGAVEVRGGHAADRRGRRLRRRGRLPRSARHGRGPRARASRSRGYTLARAARPLRRPDLTIYGPRDTDDARRDHLVPVRRHPRPRHLAGRSTRRPSACAPATTAPSR